MSNPVYIGHRIQLLPNNKQKTYFRKAIGCARLAYNWGLAEWQRRYKEGDRSMTGHKLRDVFNAIKHEQFPFVEEVTRSATAGAFDDLQIAYSYFFKGIVRYPKFRCKKEFKGSFHLVNDGHLLSEYNCTSKHLRGVAYNLRGKHQYLGVPKLGWVKMAEHARFNGRVRGATISQDGDRFYVSIDFVITEEEYQRTHPQIKNRKEGRKVGIDVGIKSSVVLSDGIAVDNPKPLKNSLRRIKRLDRKMIRCRYAKTKQEREKGSWRSKNYMKKALKTGNAYRGVTCKRLDFIQKLTTILTTHYSEICVEGLNVNGLLKNHSVAQSIIDASFTRIRIELEKKARYNGAVIKKSDLFYPSSKRCSQCGHVKEKIRLDERQYRCKECGTVLDRDYNASLNLLSLLYEDKIGAGCPESTPADLTALQSRFDLNGIATSKVETGK